MKSDASLLRWCTAAVFAGLSAYSLMFVYHGIRLVMYPYDVDNSEAYLVNQGLRIANGGFLYQPIEEEPFLVDNYPPVYPLILAAIIKLFGVSFHAARLVSLVSTLFTAFILSLWVWDTTKNKMASAYSALVFLSFYHVYDWCALARVDSLGIMLTVIGLYGAQRSWHWCVITLLMLLAIYTKQSFFAAPLAIFIYYLYTQKRVAWYFILTLFLSGILIFVLLNILIDMEAYHHLVTYNKNDYRISDLVFYVRQWVGMYTVWGCAPLLIVALGCNKYLSKNAQQSFDVPILLFGYTIFSILESALCGKIGSAPNYLLSLVCATSVGLGLIYHHFTIPNHPSSSWAVVLFMALNLTQLAGTFHVPFSGQMMYKHPLDFSYTPSTADQQAATFVSSRLKRIEAPVLIDRAGVAALADHPIVYDPFIFTQLSHQGLWDQSLILNQIQQKKFNAVVLMFDVTLPNWDRERFTQPFIESVRAHYTVEQRYGAYYFYLPN